MVELLAGPLVGAAVADKLASKNWGNLVLAIDPALLGDSADIAQRMQQVRGGWCQGAGRAEEPGAVRLRRLTQPALWACQRAQWTAGRTRNAHNGVHQAAAAAALFLFIFCHPFVGLAG